MKKLSLLTLLSVYVFANTAVFAARINNLKAVDYVAQVAGAAVAMNSAHNSVEPEQIIDEQAEEAEIAQEVAEQQAEERAEAQDLAAHHEHVYKKFKFCDKTMSKFAPVEKAKEDGLIGKKIKAKVIDPAQTAISLVNSIESQLHALKQQYFNDQAHLDVKMQEVLTAKKQELHAFFFDLMEGLSRIYYPDQKDNFAFRLAHFSNVDKRNALLTKRVNRLAPGLIGDILADATAGKHKDKAGFEAALKRNFKENEPEKIFNALHSLVAAVAVRE